MNSPVSLNDNICPKHGRFIGTNCTYCDYPPLFPVREQSAEKEQKQLESSRAVTSDTLIALLEERKELFRKNADDFDRGVQAGLLEAISLIRKYAPSEISVADDSEWAWVIKFDDTEVEDEVFMGNGAKQGALKRFEQVLMNWNAHLFREYRQGVPALDADSNYLDIRMQLSELSEVPAMAITADAHIRKIADKLHAQKREICPLPDDDKKLGQDIYDEIFDAWLTKLVGDQSVQGHCQVLTDKVMKHISYHAPKPDNALLWKPIAELEWCGEYLFGFWMEHIPMETQEFQVHHLELTESGLLTMDGNPSDFNRDDFEVFMPIPKANKPEIKVQEGKND